MLEYSTQSDMERAVTHETNMCHNNNIETGIEEISLLHLFRRLVENQIVRSPLTGEAVTCKKRFRSVNCDVHVSLCADESSPLLVPSPLIK